MIEDAIGELVKNGNKIGAIQLLVKQEGLSLKEAKDYVEQYCRENVINQPTSSGEDKPELGGRLWVVFPVAIITVFFLYFGAPYICRSTKILQGLFGVFFWLFLFARFILPLLLIFVYQVYQFIKSANKLKKLANLLLFFAVLLIVLYANYSECASALKDIVKTPVEITFKDYTITSHRMTTGRSGSSIMCYFVKIDTKEGVERIIIPMKTFKEVQQNPIHAEQPAITLSVYPHTGIVADSRSLKTLRENLMYKR